MANEEHLEIIKQGTKVWNEWKESKIKHSKILFDLIGAYLRGANLSGADLSGVILFGANLDEANLSGANLRGAYLRGAYLSHANLSGADLGGADLKGAELDGSNLKGADLNAAEFVSANLIGADLSRANLLGTNLLEGNLSEAKFYKTIFREAIFADTILSNAKHLETCVHDGPSTIDHRTLAKSGNLPLEFLRGCGLPDEIINTIPILQRSHIHFYSCFISYSTKDKKFAERLFTDLQNKGIRCWFANEDMKIGDKTRNTIDEAINKREKLLLILSKHSIRSNWVEHEVETALDEERKRKTTVLFPIRLDNEVMKSNISWVAKVKRERHIGDFKEWKINESYQKAFERLLHDLKHIKPEFDTLDRTAFLKDASILRRYVDSD